jgi:lipid-A-disaccharide synthase
VLLPGSRTGVIERNLPWMLRVAAEMRARLGDVPVVVTHERVEIARAIKAVIEREKADGWARVETGDLHTLLARARTALSVSGTVLLDLLHHALPSVVVYRLAHDYEVRLKDRLLTVPWFSSVNLLAGREIYPEFCFAGDGPIETVVDALVRLHQDLQERKNTVTALLAARRRLGPPGASTRAARHALEVALRRELTT